MLAKVPMPIDAFILILTVLPRHEAVHNASQVCKAWLAATREPSFWHALDGENGLSEESAAITNMTGMLELLSRHQFSSLKSLTPPFKVRMRKKALSLIAKACPVLEEIDLGFSLLSRMMLTDADISSVPTLFPRLNKIRFCTTYMSNDGLVAFCRRIGGRLLTLHIQGAFHKISEDILVEVARLCPNLRRIKVFSVQYDFIAAMTIMSLEVSEKLDDFVFSAEIRDTVKAQWVFLTLCFDKIR